MDRVTTTAAPWRRAPAVARFIQTTEVFGGDCLLTMSGTAPFWRWSPSGGRDGRVGALGVCRDATGETGPRFRSRPVAAFELDDFETGLPSEASRVPRETASGDDPYLQGLEACLAAREPHIRRDPCSRNWKRPPGRGTLRSPASAVTTSGITHSVNVERAPSQRASSRFRNCVSRTR